MAKRLLGESLSLGKISPIDEEGLFISVMNDAASFLCNLHSLMLALSETPTVCTIQFIEQGSILSRYTQRAVLWSRNSFHRRKTWIISILKEKKKSTVCVFFFHIIREIIRKKMNTAVVRGPTQTKRGLQATPSLLCLLARCKITHFSIFLVFNNCSMLTKPFCKTLNRKKTPNDHNFEYTLFQFLHLSYFFRRI